MKFSRYIASSLAIVFLFSVVVPSSALAISKDGVINYQVTVVKDPENPDKVLKNAWVNMYKVKVVNNEYVGTRVKTLSTGFDGYQAVFKIYPNRVVDFLPFNSKKKAKSKKNKIHLFTTPPNKNFNFDNITNLCYTAGIDFTEPLIDGETGKVFCATAENGFLQGTVYLE